MKLIQIGAEAKLFREGNELIKERVVKGYRLKEIDEKLRKFRTRRETKILNKLDFVPKIIDSDDKNMKITMEFIEGDLVKDVLDNLNKKEREKVCLKIGEQIGEMHDLDIIHGDLTTSNMIIKGRSLSTSMEIFFIDFGLGFFSKRLEDKAVDLRLFRQALESKHFNVSDECYENVINGYRRSRNSKEVLKWLEDKVEKRGRYKRKI
ncbi:MAG: KEOPS complex kinase/ATPase Bud32 [Nanoarchaeota archaeon]|mgnify:CR=1 FL=1